MYTVIVRLDTVHLAIHTFELSPALDCALAVSDPFIPPQDNCTGNAHQLLLTLTSINLLLHSNSYLGFNI